MTPSSTHAAMAPVRASYEQIKSAIVDTVRYSQSFVDPGYSSEPGDELVKKLTVKLNNAYDRWGLPNRVDMTAVESGLRDWAAAH